VVSAHRDAVHEVRAPVDGIVVHGNLGSAPEKNTYVILNLAPDNLGVEITLKLPGPVLRQVVAGAGFEPATFGL
jgi:hypothetical protein